MEDGKSEGVHCTVGGDRLEATSIMEDLHLNDLSVVVPTKGCAGAPSVDQDKETSFVDPYQLSNEQRHPPSSPRGQSTYPLPTQSQSCKEKIMFMEFQATDRQVETYESEHIYLPETPLVMTQESEESDVSMIMDLTNVDAEIEKRNSMPDMDEQLFLSLLLVDKQVDGESVECDVEIDIVDPYLETFMIKQLEVDLDKAKIQSASDVMNDMNNNAISVLLETDMTIDRSEKLPIAIEHLLKVDEDVGGNIGRSHTKVIVKEDSNATLRQNNHKEDDSIGASTQLLTDLYSSDLQVHQLSSPKRVKDDISSIMSLYEVDMEVASGASVDKTMILFNELLKTDQSVDGPVTSDEVIIDAATIDLYSEQVIRQEAIQSTSIARDAEGMNDMSSLLHVDLEMDTYREDEAMKSLQPLLEVDEEISRRNTSQVDDINNTEDTVLNFLHENDLNIERLASQLRRPETPTTTSVTNYGSKSSEEYTESDAILTDLYSSDIHVEHLSKSRLQKDDMSSIMELYDVDVKVESGTVKAKLLDESAALFKDLLKTDHAVDGTVKSDEAATNNATIDPYCEQVIRQQAIQSASILKDLEGMSGMSPLLHVDLEVGKYREDESMKCLQPLVDVDEEVDSMGRKTESNTKLETTENITDDSILNELYTCDLKLERYASRNAQNEVDDVKSIMDLYHTDMRIDSCNSHTYENEHLLSLYNDLLQTDQAIDKAQPILHASECVDPYTENVIRQVGIISRAHVQDSESMQDVTELLRIDRLVDGPQHYRYMQPMHGDEKVDDLASSEIGVCEDLPSDIAQLHAVDVLIDETSKPMLQKDHVASVMELLDVDRQIEAVKSGMNFAGEEHYRELWSVDQAVEGKFIDPSITFVDPTTEETMRQYNVKDNMHGLKDVEPLLYMDRRVDTPIYPKDQSSEASSHSQESNSKKRSIFSQREKSAAVLADVFERTQLHLGEMKVDSEPVTNESQGNDPYISGQAIASPAKGNTTQRSIFSKREKKTYGL